MDWIAGIEVLEILVGQPNPLQVIADARTLYNAYTSIQAHGLDLNAAFTSGALANEVGALARISALVETMLADKTRGPQVVALLASVWPAPTKPS